MKIYNQHPATAEWECQSIAVVLNNLEEAKAERLKEMRQPPTRDCLMKELEQTQKALEQLREQLSDANANVLHKD